MDLSSFLSHTIDVLPSRRHPSVPHVLLVALPCKGHVIALLNLARLLASRGIAVTYVCAQHRISRLQENDDDAAGGHGRLGPLIRLVGLPERVPLGDHHVGIDEGIGIATWIMDVANEMRRDFEHLVQGLQDMALADRAEAEAEAEAEAAGGSSRWQPPHRFAAAPCCIVSDAFLCWAREVAASFNLKHYVFFPMPAYTLSLMLNMPLLISQGHVPLRSSAERQLITLSGLPPLWNKDIPTFFRESDHKTSQEAILNCGFRLLEASNILVNTTYEVEAPVIDALPSTYTDDHDDFHQKKRRILTVGPVFPCKVLSNDILHLLPDDENPEQYNHECLRSWLNSKTCGSVLYVSFGSIHIPCEEEIIELALGLEASSCSFVWVLRRPPSITISKDIKDLIPLSNLLPQGFESRVKDRCFIISPWAPQLLILSHPSVGGFLTHCGWNSILESISFGKPLIAYPQFAEQRLNCRLIVDQLKVGVELHKIENHKILQREEVERAVKLLMEGEEGNQVRENTAQLKDIIRKSLDKNGSSYQNLEEFACEIFQHSANTRHT